MKSKDVWLTVTLPQSDYSYKQDYLKYSLQRIFRRRKCISSGTDSTPYNYKLKQDVEMLMSKLDQEKQYVCVSVCVYVHVDTHTNRKCGKGAYWTVVTAS